MSAQCSVLGAQHSALSTEHYQAAALAIVFHLFVVLVEEPTLRRHFGESYEQYWRDVRRWLPGKRFQSAAMNPS